MDDLRTSKKLMLSCKNESIIDLKVFRFFMTGAARCFSPQRKIEGIVKHILDNYEGVLHVRRVVGWLGFVVLGVEKIVGSNWHPSSARRSAYFRYKGKTYKVKFDHEGGKGGGIVILELAGRSTRSPEHSTVVEIKNINDAEYFYLHAMSYFE